MVWSMGMGETDVTLRHTQGPPTSQPILSPVPSDCFNSGPVTPT